MTQATDQQVADYGKALFTRAVNELNAVPDDNFAHMAEIRNLAGDVTGYAHVYTSERVRRLAHLSIDIMPGMRYFNIFACPRDDLDAPRFLHEGMISTRGSQVSMDIFHSVDMETNVKDILAKTAGMTKIYEEAKASTINFVPSRQTHMRIFCSPHFLCAFGADGEELPKIAEFGDRYLTEWLKILATADPVDATEAEQRRQRRVHMSNMMVELDPDRHMVVQVYGEETVQAIEEACMY
jgi:hypothetical protein